MPMIDLHCHVLPAVDDGPATVEEAIALAAGAAADGVTRIAATPHVDWEHPELDAARIAAEVAALQPRLDAAGVAVEILTGGEVAAGRALETDDDELRRLTLGGGPWLLLECPLSTTLAPGFASAVRALARRRHRLLLAHPERSPVFLRSPDLLGELVAEGVLVQVTASAVSGRFGRPAREAAIRFVRRGLVHVVASDGHGENRPARIAAELEGSGISPALIEWMSRAVPAALVAGEERLPPRPATAEDSARVRRRVLGLGRR